MENIYHPRRLTFIQVEDMCMFCDYPKGITLTYMVCPELLMGYIHARIVYQKPKKQ